MKNVPRMTIMLVPPLLMALAEIVVGLSFFEKDPENARNLVLIVIGTIGLWLAGWRSWTAYGQAETAERGLLNERYQKGADMLGNKVPAIRFGGVMALKRLAREHPKDHHVQIMDLLCAFARFPAHDEETLHEPFEDDETDEIRRCRPDVELAVQTIGRPDRTLIELDLEKDWRADLANAKLRDANLANADLTNAKLRGAKLQNADLQNAKLRNAKLQNADLQNAFLQDANLKNAKLQNANLADAKLQNANLTDANLTDANLTDSNLTKVKGLTQDQLDLALIEDGGEPPELSNAVCAASGEPLVWKAKTSSV